LSEENVELMRGVYAEMARGNFWALAPLLHEDVEWEWDRRHAALIGGPRVFRGPESVERATKEWFSAWEWFTIDAEEFIDKDDLVVVLTRYRARPKHGGTEIDQQAADVWTLRSGKVVGFHGYRNRSEALETAGLPKG
jgi:ketosteroid isomerase-like protein